MTIKKAMVLTIEQEQLLYKLLARLQEADFPVEFDPWQGGYCCPVCGGEPTSIEKDFQHASNCPLVLAQQLRKTINE